MSAESSWVWAGSLLPPSLALAAPRKADNPNIMQTVIITAIIPAIIFNGR